MTSRSDLSVVFNEPKALTEGKPVKSSIKVIGARDIEHQIWLPPTKPLVIEALNGVRGREQPAKKSIGIVLVRQDEETEVIQEELPVEEAQELDDKLSLFDRVYVHGKNKVLLVDDNIWNSIAVQFMFQRYGADADISTNG